MFYLMKCPVESYVSLVLVTLLHTAVLGVASLP